MVLIRYYNLESKSLEDVSNLEKDLKKRLLDEKRIRKSSSTSIEDVAEMREGDQDAVTRLVYDSGEFDILYKATKTITTEKKHWFKKNIAPRVGIELVVKGTPEDIVDLQTYLGDSKFEVVEAKAVATATLSFATIPTHKEGSEAHLVSIEELIKRDYATLKSTIKIANLDTWKWDGREGTYCSGLITGNIEEILQLRYVLSCFSRGVRKYFKE